MYCSGAVVAGQTIGLCGSETIALILQDPSGADEPFDGETRIAGWRRIVTDDIEMWRGISRGDSAAFDVFYRENAPRLQAFLRQVVGSCEAAEDLAQETFLQIWNRPSGFQPERGTLRSYLYGIARKRAAEWWRKHTPTSPDHEDSPGACQTEAVSMISDALLHLPEEQRVLLWLREVEGQSYAELATVLDVPVGTVRSRLFTAREALRTIWRSKPLQCQGGKHEVQ
jgi:RNA polymerase sigma-70 factor (ECF subfamily)